MERKQNSTDRPIEWFHASSIDHNAGATGLTCTVTISKNGGGFGAPSGAVSEVGNGWYKLAGNATDRATLGTLVVHSAATGADPADVSCEIVAMDTQVACTPANVLQMFGTNLTAQITAAWVKFFDKASPTGHVNSIPDAVAGAANGLPVIDATGVKLAKTVDLTAGQSIAVSDKTGFALATAPPTAPDIATAVWGATTRTLSSFGSLVADVATAVWGAVSRTLTSAGGITAADVWAYATRTLTALPTDAAKESTLTAMKGAGWTTETLRAIYEKFVTIQGEGDTLKEYVSLDANGDPLQGVSVMAKKYETATPLVFTWHGPQISDVDGKTYWRGNHGVDSVDFEQEYPGLNYATDTEAF